MKLSLPNLKQMRVRVAILSVALLVVFLFPHVVSSLFLYYVIIGLIGALWTLGTNFYVGYCGQVNFGVTAAATVAGYSYALLVTRLGMHFIAALLLSMMFSSVTVYIVSTILLRLRHLLLALGTLAFGMVCYVSVRSGFVKFTGGEGGINIPHVFIFGNQMGDTLYYYVLVVAVAIAAFVGYAILHSRTGRAMKAIAQDEAGAAALGVNVTRYLRLALLLDSICLGLAGVVYAQWNNWASPEFYGLWTNIAILLAGFLGGRGSPLGAIIGGMFIFLLPHLIITFAQFQPIVYGVILILVLRFAPEGMVGIARPLASRFIGELRR